MVRFGFGSVLLGARFRRNDLIGWCKRSVRSGVQPKFAFDIVLFTGMFGKNGERCGDILRYQRQQ